MSTSGSLGRNNIAEVVIIGGGVIGLTVARALALRGARHVTLIEKNEFGREASWAAGGILAPQVEADQSDDFFRLACASRDLYAQFANDLMAESDVDVELDTTGTLYVGFTETDESELRRRFAWQRAEQLRVEWLDGDEARQLEPCLSDKVRCALRFPFDYQVENRKLLAALLTANERLSVRLIRDCEACVLRIDGSKVAGLETSQGFIKTGTVVLAAGAWTSSIESSPPLPLDVEPVRGQMLCFEANPQLARHVIYSARGYLIPRRDGRLLAGSTTEHVGFDKRVTVEGIERIKEMAFEISPAVSRLPLIDSWAGFRPRALDDLPVLGRPEEIDGLVYATGHYRNGILLAPITGELIADVILTGAAAPMLKTFSPERFNLESTANLIRCRLGAGYRPPGISGE
jgi:glycine oxidase